MSNSFSIPWIIPRQTPVHGISQARILDGVSISFSRGSSQPRDRTLVSCIAGRFFTTQPPGKPNFNNIFYLTQYMKNINISTHNSIFRKLLMRYVPFFFVSHTLKLSIYFTFTKAHLIPDELDFKDSTAFYDLVATIMDSTAL